MHNPNISIRLLSVLVTLLLASYVVTSESYAFEMDTSLADSDASFIGEDIQDYAGDSVSGVGDVNGDGYDDFLIAADSNSDGGVTAGQTYLILGKGNGWDMNTSLADSDASFIGEDDENYSGVSISGAGDVDGDGYDDFLIGAYGNSEGGEYVGQTYLILGKESGWRMDTSLADSDASFIGESTGSYAYSGVSVSGAGDVNGDGYDDFLIGSTGNNEGGANAGQTYLIFGKARGWSMDTRLADSDASFIGEDEENYSGVSVAGVGDVNGDRYDDFLIGASYNSEVGDSAGQTYLILGKEIGWSMDTNLASSDASFTGEFARDISGDSVSGVGDVNGDGYDDFLIGAHENSEGGNDAGQSYLILGKENGWDMDTSLADSDASFIGENANDYAGYFVAGVGDVNDDGYDDFLIGAHENDEGGASAGQSYLILGKENGWDMDTSLADSDASFIGENANDGTAHLVSGAGDVNGDGVVDILLGAPGTTGGTPTNGKAYLLFGAAQSQSQTQAQTSRVFSKDTRCLWSKPGETTWIKLEPKTQDNMTGMYVTWTQYGANKVNIKIDDGSGNYPWLLEKTINDGHEFLPNVHSGQNIKLKPINHCKAGEFSPEVSYSTYPKGWYNTE